ncbi:alpha amylase, catalytic domain protein [Mycobacterium xenopi 4042]|uniref:Alpha amylase, catalytic domain protein n=1 Tax=Mycobacterium xenopi 4042 TaxID=1299334 RepID=X8ANH7_MYCXE|nr:alpha amylase, catalytic domain protein [Mycobacterium xenopi 3993]EUA33164.1 alpha amylase, catalytic domain protein [Mycobacterium xenopi 4042]
MVPAPVRRRAAGPELGQPEVFDDLEKTLRFWLERGVDGFRIDVAHGMAKPPACRT